MWLQWPQCKKRNFWGHPTAAVWSRIEITVFFLSPAVLTGSKWKTKPESSQYQCQNGAVLAHDDRHTVDCLQIRSVERVSEKGAQEVRSAESNRRQSSSKLVEPRELLHCGTGRLELATTPENLPQDEQGSKASRMAKSSSPKARRGSTNTPSPPTGRTEKKQRSSSKSVSPNWDATEKNATTTQNHHAEQMTKYGDVHLRSVCFEIGHVQVKAELKRNLLFLCLSDWSRSWGGWRPSCRRAGRASRSCEVTSATWPTVRGAWDRRCLCSDSPTCCSRASGWSIRAKLCFGSPCGTF